MTKLTKEEVAEAETIAKGLGIEIGVCSLCKKRVFEKDEGPQEAQRLMLNHIGSECEAFRSLRGLFG